MKVCDICKKHIDSPEIFEILNRRYELCYLCARKVKKYIRYETARKENKCNRHGDSKQ